VAVASAGPYVGTNLIHGEKCVISQDVSENMPNFTENSWAHRRYFEVSC